MEIGLKATQRFDRRISRDAIRPANVIAAPRQLCLHCFNDRIQRRRQLSARHRFRIASRGCRRTIRRGCGSRVGRRSCRRVVRRSRVRRGIISQDRFAQRVKIRKRRIAVSDSGDAWKKWVRGYAVFVPFGQRIAVSAGIQKLPGISGRRGRHAWLIARGIISRAEIRSGMSAVSLSLSVGEGGRLHELRQPELPT